MKSLLTVLTLAACARGELIERPRVGAANGKLVARILYYASESSWRRSGFWRLDDQPRWPWQVFVAHDGTACPSFTLVVDEPMINDVWVCSIPWRQRRPV